MLAYQEKDNLVHKLHPFAALAYMSAVFVLALVLSHPAYLFGLFFAVGAVIIVSDMYVEWRAYLKLAVVMTVVIVLINAFVAQAGSTPIFAGSDISFLRHVRITVEGLAYGAGMGLRLLVVISIFCLYTYAVHPDKALGLFARSMTRSVLVIILATRLFPLLAGDFQRITEVQRCRGVKFEGERWWRRARNLLPVASALLLSSLERSLLLAESMDARGFGSGRRSSYRREYWRPRDWLVTAGAAAGCITAITASGLGWVDYRYYPVLDHINTPEAAAAFVMSAFLLTPAVLSWGWKRWPWLRSKI